MPSSKAIENKTLASRCANPACGKQQSTELMVGLTVGAIGRRRQVTVCAACAEQGWRPPDGEADTAAAT
jgi:hypothetical protein